MLMLIERDLPASIFYQPHWHCVPPPRHHGFSSGGAHVVRHQHHRGAGGAHGRQQGGGGKTPSGAPSQWRPLLRIRHRRTCQRPPEQQASQACSPERRHIGQPLGCGRVVIRLHLRYSFGTTRPNASFPAASAQSASAASGTTAPCTAASSVPCLSYCSTAGTTAPSAAAPAPAASAPHSAPVSTLAGTTAVPTAAASGRASDNSATADSDGSASVATCARGAAAVRGGRVRWHLLPAGISHGGAIVIEARVWRHSFSLRRRRDGSARSLLTRRPHASVARPRLASSGSEARSLGGLSNLRRDDAESSHRRRWPGHPRLLRSRLLPSLPQPLGQ